VLSALYRSPPLLLGLLLLSFTIKKLKISLVIEYCHPFCIKDVLAFHTYKLITCLGAKIEEILLHWKGDYGRLERHHGYIQW